MLIYEDIYTILLPLTKFISFILLEIIGTSASILGNSIIVGNNSFNLISSCVALPAYYLLLFLILTTKDISLKKSFLVFFSGIFLILIMNVIRIDLLIIAFVKFGKPWFDYIHIFFWKFVSGVYVAIVWIWLTKKNKINSIPIYDDLKYLYSRSLFK